MPWYHYASYFAGGLFLANTVPHLVNGISGRPFQSPFAKPPGKGLSSSTINVLWGMLNLGFAWFLIFRVGSFQLSDPWQVLPVGIGMTIMSVLMARNFGHLHGGNLK
jgi:hypothetical protein